jgi:hypothetical protein
MKVVSLFSGAGGLEYINVQTESTNHQEQSVNLEP